MGLIIIFGILTLIFIIMVVIGLCVDVEGLFVSGLTLGILTLITTIGMSIGGACTQAFIEKDYEAMLLRKQVIEYRMQHEDIINAMHNI